MFSKNKSLLIKNKVPIYVRTKKNCEHIATDK